MKNFILFFLLLFVTSSLQAELSNEEKNWIKIHPIATVGGGPDWAPFDFVNSDEKYNGIANDYLNLITKKTGLKFNVIVDKWSNNLQKMKEQKIDILHAVYFTDERAKYMNYTSAYFEMLDFFFIREDLEVKTLKDLNGKRVAVPKGYAHGDIIKKEFPQIKIIYVDTFKESIDAVLENRADILFDTYTSLSYVLKKESISTIIPFKSYRGHGAVKLHMSTHKENKILRDILDKGLALITQEEKDKIHNRWLSKNTTIDSTLTLTQKENNWLSENPTITFTGDPNWLPFEAFDKDGNYEGIVANYLKEIEKSLPSKFKPIQVDTWLETLELAKEGKVDVISDTIDSEGMRENYTPIRPYLNTPIVIVMRSTQDFVNDLGDVSDQKIALIKGYGYNVNVRKKYPNQKFIYLDNADIALENLLTGKIDVAILSMPKAGYLIRSKGYTSLKIVGKTSVDMHLSLFVLNSKPELHAILERTMASLPKEKHSQMIKEWLDVEFAEKTDYTLLYQIAGLLGFFLLGTVYWNRKLSHEINERKTIEGSLQKEKKNFKVLFEEAPTGNLIIQDGKFTTCNSAALEMLGLDDISQLLDSSPSRWSPEYQNDGQRSAQKEAIMIEKCLQDGTHRFEWIHKDIHGKEFWVDVGLTKISYHDRVSVYVIWRDIEEQKTLENTLKDSEAQIKTLINNIPLYVIVTTTEGKILLANPKTLHDLNIKEKDIKQANILEFYADVVQRQEFIEELQSNGKVNEKIVNFVHPKGNIVKMMLSALPITFDNQKALLTLGVDMTQRVEMEKELATSKEMAEEANRAKSEFLANMSHEIRTPMNSVIGFSELLAKEIRDPIQKDYLDSILRGGNALLGIINDILDLSKIESGKFEIIQESVDIRQLATEMQSIFSIKFVEKNIHFELDIDPTLPKYLLLDATRIRQILFNLLGNAIKFTESGTVTLCVTKVFEDEEKSKIDLQLSVEDSGIGIEKENLEHIFDAFEQQQGQNANKYGGTGLGLAICKKLSIMMNGDLQVESILGEGSKFTVDFKDIPISAIEAIEDVHKNIKADIIFEKATILVVDDIPDNRKLVLSALSKYGLTVIEAEDGQDALDKLQNIHVDLIFMDIKMPVMDGYEATKIIKEDVTLRNIPVIALTASVMGKDLDKIEQYNFDGYLRKPVTLHALIGEMGRFLKHESFEPKELATIDTSNYINISEVLKELETTQLTTWRAIKEEGDFALIEVFSGTLLALGEANHITILVEYAKTLKMHCESYDIERIDIMMNSYPSLIEQLRGQNNE